MGNLKSSYYLTTPLYYVNSKPHIGHAYTNVLCDSFARYRRLCGDEVFFLTGTDEHGTKIEKIAREQNKTPKEFVDEMVPQFKSLWEILEIRYDFFIRTTDEQHKQSVQAILTDLEKRDEIYRAEYKGWYCTPCESFWTELQLVAGKCPDCSRDVQELKEENYFFRLSKYQDWLIEYIRQNPDFVQPEIRKNEILGFLKQPLEDLCITRPKSRLSWGIDYPGSSDHVVYVWFDALINYVSALHYPQDSARFEKLWPADVHVVGKDILRQHAVYWPIMLKACGLAMPKRVLAHGWWTMAGAKVSKSRGNIVDPIQLVQKYGIDAFRYFLLHEVTVGFDGAYSEDLLRERYTSDLANDLGNLWHRFASMIGKYYEGQFPAVSSDAWNHPLIQNTLALRNLVHDAMVSFDPRAALDRMWAVITLANQFVEETKPWVLAKQEDKKEALAAAMWQLGECIAHVGLLLEPFMPVTSGIIKSRLGLTQPSSLMEPAFFDKPLIQVGQRIDRGEPLFPKLEEIPEPL